MAWLQDGIERLLKATGGRDQPEYWSAYNDCLWRATTSGRLQLEQYVTQMQQEPYNNLPMPLLILICRVYVLEFPQVTPQVMQAINFIFATALPGKRRVQRQSLFTC
jgi:hypothetical protein